MGISSLVYDSWMKEIQFKKYEGMMPMLEQVDTSGKILDVGIGTALFEDFLKGKGIKLNAIGIEIDSIMLDKARKKGYDVTAGSAESLPFEDNSFDFVVCLDTIHAVDNKDKAINEIRRVLRPGTLLLISHYSNTFTRNKVIERLEALLKDMIIVDKKVVGASDQEQSVVFLVKN